VKTAVNFSGAVIRESAPDFSKLPIDCDDCHRSAEIAALTTLPAITSWRADVRDFADHRDTLA